MDPREGSRLEERYNSLQRNLDYCCDDLQDIKSHLYSKYESIDYQQRKLARVQKKINEAFVAALRSSSPSSHFLIDNPKVLGEALSDVGNVEKYRTDFLEEKIINLMERAMFLIKRSNAHRDYYGKLDDF